MSGTILLGIFIWSLSGVFGWWLIIKNQNYLTFEDVVMGIFSVVTGGIFFLAGLMFAGRDWVVWRK